ncbi:MAG: biotin--[acetyl-CoA-carboxylase] ligase [Pseudomonadota bacterium]
MSLLPPVADTLQASALQVELDAWLAHATPEVSIRVFDELGSTNTWLLAQDPPPSGQTSAALTVHQSAGRGQHGRVWMSEPGAGLYLSVAHTWLEPPREPQLVPMVLGVYVAGALSAAGLDALKIKWPNDFVWQGRKLGGMLVESTSLADGRFFVVAGIGINRDLPPSFELKEGQSWSAGPVDLKSAGLPVSLPALVKLVLPAAADALAEFPAADLAAVRQRFDARAWEATA